MRGMNAAQMTPRHRLSDHPEMVQIGPPFRSLKDRNRYFDILCWPRLPGSNTPILAATPAPRLPTTTDTAKAARDLGSRTTQRSKAGYLLAALLTIPPLLLLLLLLFSR